MSIPNLNVYHCRTPIIIQNQKQSTNKTKVFNINLVLYYVSTSLQFIA